MSERGWFVVGSLAGLRVEQHNWPPDTALAGPYRDADAAVAAMGRMVARDHWERLFAWGLVVAGSLTLAGVVVWSLT